VQIQSRQSGEHWKTEIGLIQPFRNAKNQLKACKTVWDVCAAGAQQETKQWHLKIRFFKNI
jgi:hypothetical protein